MVLGEVGGARAAAKETCLAALNGRKLSADDESIEVLKQLRTEEPFLR